jgi:glutamine amidotransferase
VYRDVRPAWNDENLRDLAAHVESPLFVAHARSATEGLVQRANCHPFRHDRWLLVHNGSIRGFRDLKRELMLSVDPALFPEILGTTDSEVMFYLALTFGLEEEPLPALQRMAGFVEKVGHENGVEHPVEMTLGLSDGVRVIAVRYSSDGQSPSLFHSKSIRALKELAPGGPRLERFSEEATAIVSEPLTELTDVWVEIPESSSLVVTGEEVVSAAFRPDWS